MSLELFTIQNLKTRYKLALKFSIIVPVYNRPKEIDELLESLTTQDFSDDFEVLIMKMDLQKKVKAMLRNIKENSI